MKRAILDGRLAIPHLPPRHVPRPRLLAALDQAVERPLTLVAAGPGWGKSVLLSDWAATRTPKPAWISLEASDNDASHFWATVDAALRAADIAPVMSSGLPPAAVPPSALAVALDGAVNEPVVLILDDAHVLTDAAIRQSLDGCIRFWGERLRLVVAARSDPLLPVHRYRRSGEVSELRAADLAMTDDESTAVLAAHGVRLSQRDFDRLSARTEGWPAGLGLSAMSVAGTEHPSEFVTELALDRGSIGEYLIDEVLDRQPTAVRRLLLETSFLTEVNGDLAAAVTGLDEAPGLLSELSRTNSFVRVDPATGSVRYHQLLSEILRYLLRGEPASYRRGLLQRAANWYLDSDELVPALHYAAEAEDWGFAARVLTRGGFARALIERVELDEVGAEELAAEASESDESWADLIVAAAALYALGGRPDQAREQLDRLVGDPAAGVAESAAITIALVELLIARARLDIAAADRWAAAVAERSEEPALRAVAALERALTHFYGRSNDCVASVLRSAAANARAAGEPALELTCIAQLAHVHSFWGRFRTSTSFEQQANVLLRDNTDLVVPATLYYAAGARAFSNADFAATYDLVRRAATAQIDQRDHDLRSEIVLLETMMFATGGRLAEAQQSTRSVNPDLGGLIADYRAFVAANLETALGRPNVAVQLLTEQAQSTPAGLTSAALGRALLARGDLDAATTALRPILRGPDTTCHTPALIDALITDAQIAQAQQHDDTRAVRDLVRAIALADGEFIVPFVKANPRLADLRRRHPQLLDKWPVAEDASVEIADLDVVLDVDSALDEELTERERAVLRWLATTMSTNEIAVGLCLSVNTVKTHIAAIYRKLDATRRRDAVVRARELELL